MKRTLLVLLALGGTAIASPAIPPETLLETRTYLKELTAIDTSNPPGNEIAAVKWAEKILKKEKIEIKILESEKGRTNLWARIKGNGSKKPFIITAHLDVVGAKKEDWQSDPFQPTEKDGFLYGRGVIDDKGMAAAGISVMKLLARAKPKLDRDVILLLGADEESGSNLGIRWLIENHPDLLEADAVINEGGPILIEEGKITHASIQNYEKLYMDVTLETEGASGHSSLPGSDNAVTRIARAMAHVGRFRFPVQLNEVTQAHFEGLAKLPDNRLAKEMEILLAGPTKKKQKEYDAAVERLTAVPAYNAYLRTTCTPTVIKAGFRNNAIPGKAEANVNCRVLPTESPEAVLAKLTEVIDDTQVKLTASEIEQPAMSPIDHPFFEATRKVIGEMNPEAVVVPYMSAGATDSRFLRHKGIASYGFLPFPMAVEDKAKMHGNDERIELKSLDWGVEFLYRLVITYAGSDHE